MCLVAARVGDQEFDLFVIHGVSHGVITHYLYKVIQLMQYYFDSLMVSCGPKHEWIF
jgi:hypothetical protein